MNFVINTTYKTNGEYHKIILNRHVYLLFKSIVQINIKKYRGIKPII